MPDTPLTRYAVIGSPVAHSQSPFIHAAFAQATGEAIDYGRIECAAGAFDSTVRAFAAHGAGGCNVTVPFKFEAVAIAPRLSARARLAGAANTLRFDRDGWFGDNTDGIGLVRDIEVHAQQPIAGTRVLLVGAGGAAAGVLGPLLDARPRSLVLVNRSRERAEALVQRHAGCAEAAGTELRCEGLATPGWGYDIVINATASSLHGAAVPVPASVLHRDALAVDLMYGPAAAPFLGWARLAGVRARDGLGMLVEQAAEAFFVWRGVHPQTAPVLQALRERLAAKA